MESISLPSKIEILPGKKSNEATASIQPCYPGYGTTLGNALRRVLLSSLPGAAVTAFKIKGVSHEFSAIPHVKEDVVEIALNLKQLRLKVFSAEPVKLELKVKGEKQAKAGDIKANSDVEIVSTDLVIANLTNKDAELDMEIIVSQGRGYIPTEAREKEELEVGMITVDSIYTPVVNVGFQIENVRVGQMTNYENLILTIETDGTITPKDALEQANKVLIDHLNFVDDQLQGKTAAEETKSEEKTEQGEEQAEVKDEVLGEEKPKKRGRPKKTEAKSE